MAKNNNPDRFKAKLDKIIKAWKDKAPGAEFAGMTVNEFATKVKPCYDARKKIEDGESMVKTGINERTDADSDANKEVELVVASVIGTREFGSNSDLYEQMGYKRKSERKSGLTRKKKDAGGAPA